MGETLPSVPSLRHGRDPNESRAGTSGRSNSLYSVLPQQLTLLAVPPGCESCTSNQSIPRLLLLCCLISFVLLGLQFMDGQTLEAVLLWIDKEPLKGSLLFIAADIIGVTVLFPGAIFAMAGGAIFGVGYGSLLVWIATSLGQTLAFVVGRYLLRGMVVSYLSSRFPKWTAVDAALSNEGWKLITLLRLSPVVPWNVLNYALSVTGVGLLPYALSSAVAIIPWSITFVYFGSMAKSMADILEGRAGPHGASSVALLASSGVMLVAVVVYSTIIARRAIREALSKGGNSNDEELQAIVVRSSEDAEADMGSGMSGKAPSMGMSGGNSEASSRRSTATERQEGLR